MTQRKKKTIEYHFVDMNDPDRYKKLKVGRACDFCRRRKSKCDIGVPGSGTCSNCKKSNQTCIFSAVQQPQPQQQQQATNTFTDGYRDKFPFLSMDAKAHCSYERDNIYAHTTLTNYGEEPVYSKQSEHEIFDVYFGHFHPFFPLLDKHQILQSLRFDNMPLSLSLAIMAIASCHFTHTDTNAAFYYTKAIDTLDHSPCLSSVQTLFLLYKYGEMVTPVGTPISSLTIGYLKEAQSILAQLPTQLPNQNNSDSARQDEFRSRAQWLIYITLSFGNIADQRWREALDYCIIPTKKPELTEIEHYDKNELNTTCNLIQLANLALIFSPTVCFMADQNTLFATNMNDFLPEFLNYATRLERWKAALPPPIAHSLYTNHLYTVQDGTKSPSFTTYLCLIHDIISLLVTIHQPDRHAHLSRLALAVCYRAHCLTVGDLAPSTFSRVASIQGSRLVTFALTLALQTQSYCEKNNLSLEAHKNYEACCDLTFQIFDQISLSPQLYMTINALRAQRESEAAAAAATLLTSEQIENRSSGREERPHYSTQSSYSSNESNYTSTTDYSYYTPIPQPSHTSTRNTQTTSMTGDWQTYSHYTTSNYDSLIETQYEMMQDTAMPTTPTFQHTEPTVIIDSYYSLPMSDSRRMTGPVVASSYFYHHEPLEVLYDAKS
ncbi:hypothetical protein INT47_001988, partial [Mucor saturninus]